LFEETKVDNADGFFTGLPISSSKSKNKRLGLSSVMSSAQREQLKLAKLEQKANVIQQQLQI